MTTARPQATTAQTRLRKKAENRLRGKKEQALAKSPHEVKVMFHELHVHQIELEMQNEELRLREQELELVRERMTELYDHAPVGYVTLNKQRKIIEANLTVVSMLCLARSELVGQLFSRFISSKDQDAFHRCMTRVFEEQKGQVCEIRLRPVAGGAVFFARLEVLPATGGREEACRMTISDITSQKRAEEQHRVSERNRLQHESDEWKRLALEAGELGAWDQDLRDPRGTITCTGETCKMLGLNPNGKPTWNDLVSHVHAEDRPQFLREIELATLPEGARRADLVFRTVPRQGKVYWLRMVFSTSFVNNQNPAEAARRTGVLADITQLKEAQETLRTQAEKLDKLVQERTARLQDAVADLEHLSYTLVHDLRAPLRAICGYSNLLLKQCKDLDPVHKSYLERSYAAASRMDGLIIDTLAYSQVSRQSITLERVEPVEVLRQLMESYPQFQEARQHITIHEPLPPVRANSALLSQCFSNLIANALKFVRHGQEPVVRIYARDWGDHVTIWFQDEGIGISEEDRTRIFRMFQRLHTDYEGTGIGLSLVKKAIERMKGNVGFESDPGRGTKFWLELEKAK